MLWVVAAVVLLVVVWMRRRASKATRLAGLDSSVPVFSVSPPGGRLNHNRKGERL